jgi:hypothetical protein
MITTKQPSDDMIEVAIVSMEQALVADGASIPVGSSEFEQRPMRLPEMAPGPATAPTLPAAPVGTTAPTDPPPGS